MNDPCKPQCHLNIKKLQYLWFTRKSESVEDISPKIAKWILHYHLVYFMMSYIEINAKSSSHSISVRLRHFNREIIFTTT